jgi:hypothetical protein
MLGWRKLTAWFLVYAATYATLWMGWDMTETTADVIKWTTGFFFGANALKPLAQNITIGPAPK